MKSLCLLFVATLLCAVSSYAQLGIGVETGAVFNGYNNIRIPAKGGTEFSFTDDFRGQPAFHYRFTVDYTLKGRHHFILLAAPLRMLYYGTAPKDIVFGRASFTAGQYLRGVYRFNSYRFTYRYDIVKRPKIEFGLGFTAKIRDAKISLSSSDKSGTKYDVGFAPLINFNLWWHLTPSWGLLLNGDALWVPQGRAEDVLAAVTFKPLPYLRLYAGYRILEGGSNSKSVYLFSLFNYAVIGMNFTIGKK